jgi:ferredoxin/flavodoxin---NADP+ reductase
MTAITPTDKATVQTVTSLHWWNKHLLSFTTTKPEHYSFAAGQYARLGLPDAGGTIWRAYSMTSAPQDDQLEFYGILVPDGLFTSLLKNIKAGDPILIEKQVYGFMTPDRFVDGDDLWMLATGTGIGPFISILRDPYVWQKFRNLVIVHGVRHVDEFSYRELLRSLQHSPPAKAPHARLSIIETLTRDPVAAAGHDILHGRITTLLENGLLEKAAGLPITVDASRVMMCGNPAMIEEMRRLLHQRGMRPCRRALPGQFVTENYW